MKIKVLVDNNTYIDQYYCGEPAVSYYIEDEDTSLLLDVGYSDLFLKNATALGVDIENISTIYLDMLAQEQGYTNHDKDLLS